MHEDNQLNPAEREFESALRQLRPADHAIDRDQLMYSAGQRAARRSQHRWQAATAALTVLLAASWTLQLAVPTPPQLAETPSQEEATLEVAAAIPALPEIPERLAAVPPEIWPPVPQYVHLRNRVVEDGLDALEGMQLASATGTQGDSVDDELDTYFPARGAGYPRAFGSRMDIGG